MDDTTTPLEGPAAAGPGRGAGGGTLTDIQRTADGRMVAGVCAGIGRYLGIDPVIARILFAVLTLVGFGGVIAYAAAWILLPDEQTGESYLKRWFGLGDNEPQIRLVGLGAAALVAATWSWGWGWPAGPLWIAAVAVIAWVGYREHQERKRRRTLPAPPSYAPAAASYPPSPPAPPPPPPVKPPKRPNPRHDHGTLSVITLSLMLIVTGVLLVATEGDLAPSVYVASAVGTLALGMLVGTVAGNARPLILPAIIAVGLLAFTTIVPRWDAGRVEAAPVNAVELRDDYAVGVGEVVVDLREIADPAALDGRRLDLEAGLGTVRVYVPDTLDVDLDASVDAGSISALGYQRGGVQTSLEVAQHTERPDLALNIDVTIGDVEVIRS